MSYTDDEIALSDKYPEFRQACSSCQGTGMKDLENPSNMKDCPTCAGYSYVPNISESALLHFPFKQDRWALSIYNWDRHNSWSCSVNGKTDESRKHHYDSLYDALVAIVLSLE